MMSTDFEEPSSPNSSTVESRRNSNSFGGYDSYSNYNEDEYPLQVMGMPRPPPSPFNDEGGRLGIQSRGTRTYSSRSNSIQSAPPPPLRRTNDAEEVERAIDNDGNGFVEFMIPKSNFDSREVERPESTPTTQFSSSSSYHDDDGQDPEQYLEIDEDHEDQDEEEYTTATSSTAGDGHNGKGICGRIFCCDSLGMAFILMGILVFCGLGYIGVLLYNEYSTPAGPSDGTNDSSSTNVHPSFDLLEDYFDDLLVTLQSADLQVDDIQDPTSAAYEALEWMAFEDGLLLNDLDAIKQRYALIFLYFSTGGTDFWDKEWLLPGESECNFEGVECTDAGEIVTSLDLKSRSLVGPLPNEISWLTKLQHLDMRNNRLSGTIPQDLFIECTDLKQVEFSFNKLVGRGPSDLGLLSSLEVINLQGNFLTGSLPQTIPKSLIYLMFDQNEFSGSIPSTWFDMKGNEDELYQMEILELSFNPKLSGEFPNEIDHFKKLRSISIGGRSNFINGTIPSSIGNLHATLDELSIPGTMMSGTIPTEFYQLSKLQWFVAGNNYGLVGPLHENLGQMTALQVLQLSHTSISGPIPSEIGLLDNLQWFQVTSSNLSGTIPTEMGQLDSLSKYMLSSVLAIEQYMQIYAET